jgi:hypothetical protein
MPIVQSAFGRATPHVVAETGDYTATQVSNDSDVPGEDVGAALELIEEALLTRAKADADLGGDPELPRVVGLQGRAIQDVDPSDGAKLRWSAANQRWEPQGSSAAAGAGWQVLYEVDLRAQTPIPSIGIGSFEIDGKIWWCKGAFRANESAALVAGQGLRLVMNGLTPYYYGNGGFENTPSLYFPFAELDGYHEDAPIALQAWFQSIPTAYPSNVFGVLGMIGAEADALGLQNEEHMTGLYWTYDGDQSNARPVVVYYNNSYNYVATTYTTPVSEHLFTIVHPGLSRTMITYVDNVPAQNFAPLDQLHYPRAFPTPVFPAPTLRSYGLYFSQENHVGPPFGNQTATLGGFRVLQPKG